MQKINVIGTSGSGKSTFATLLAKQLSYPHIEMDQIYWGKNWSEPDDATFFAKLESHLQTPYWVLDGNYSRTNAIKWQKVDAIIWIDFGFVRTLFQALKRAIIRIVSHKELWPNTGNKETLKKLFSKDSIVLWTIKCYHKNKVRYGQLLDDPTYQHIQFVRLTSPKACKEYLLHLKSGAESII